MSSGYCGDVQEVLAMGEGQSVLRGRSALVVCGRSPLEVWKEAGQEMIVWGALSH